MKGKPILPKVLCLPGWELVNTFPKEKLALWWKKEKKTLALCDFDGKSVLDCDGHLRVLRHENTIAYWGGDSHFYFAKIINKSKVRY